MKIIVYKNDIGSVSICVPTGLIPIEDVLAKDCPNGSLIIDDSELPQGDNAQFYYAWELVDNKIVINFSKAQTIALEKFNAKSLEEAKLRQLNTLSGINNTLDDATWLSILTNGRQEIENAKTTSDLMGVLNGN